MFGFVGAAAWTAPLRRDTFGRLGTRFWGDVLFRLAPCGVSSVSEFCFLRWDAMVDTGHWTAGAALLVVLCVVAKEK